MSSEGETSLDVYTAGMIRDLIRSLPVRSTSGLPVYVAVSPAVPFSTALRSARNDNLAGGSLYRGAQNTLFDLEQPIANDLANGFEKIPRIRATVAIGSNN